jgi:hypothetical protein
VVMRLAGLGFGRPDDATDDVMVGSFISGLRRVDGRSVRLR